MKDARITLRDLDEVLLVRVVTRVPKEQLVVNAALFGKEPGKGVDPVEKLAMVATIQGSILKGDVKELLLLNLNP